MIYDKSKLLVDVYTRLRGISIGLCLLFSTAIAQAQAPTPVKLGIIYNGVEYYSVFVADKKGFFKKNGLDVEIISTSSSSRSVQMVATRAIDIGSSSWLDTVRAMHGGAEVKSFANGLHTSITMLIGAKDINSLQDLKGKRVSTGGAKDITNVWWNAMSRSVGLNQQKDSEVIFAGASSARFAALAAGGVQAAVVGPPLSFKAIQDGYKDLGIMGPYLPNVPYMTWHANSDWLQKNTDAMVRFVRANNEAIDFINANRQESAEILAKSSSVSIDDALKTHDMVLKVRGFNRDSSVKPECIKGILDVLVDFGDIKDPRSISFYYDDKYVKAASPK